MEAQDNQKPRVWEGFTVDQSMRTICTPFGKDWNGLGDSERVRDDEKNFQA